MAQHNFVHSVSVIVRACSPLHPFPASISPHQPHSIASLSTAIVLQSFHIRQLNHGCIADRFHGLIKFHYGIIFGAIINYNRMSITSTSGRL